MRRRDQNRHPSFRRWVMAYAWNDSLSTGNPAVDAEHKRLIEQVKRLLEAAGPQRVLNLTYGYPRQSVALLDNGCLAVLSLSVEELLERLNAGELPR